MDNERIQAIVDANARTLSDQDLSNAAGGLKPQQGRGNFRLDQLLPNDLAEAAAEITRKLPADALTTTLMLLCGYSGLLKIGTHIQSSHRYGVPCNLFVALVGQSGQQKTPLMRALILDPAAAIRSDAREHFQKEKDTWRQECQGQAKKDRPDPPKPLFPHLQDYTPESLAIQLELHETKGLGLLLIRDEISGVLQAVEADSKRGRGTGEAQLLELFDGTGATSIRVGSDARQFERCHVSLYGNIQPGKLRQLVNGDDCTGKFARFLFCSLPNTIASLCDRDPTEAEQRRYQQAQQVLADKAEWLYRQPPRQFRLSVEARTAFHRWWEEHQREAQSETTSSVVSAMLGKASAHALRVAAMLHMVRSSDQQVSEAIMVKAMAIVDQLISETKAFHASPADQATLLMQHILTIKGDVDWTKCRNKGGRAIRAMKAADFAAAVRVLEESGLGTVIENKNKIVFRSSTSDTR